MSEGVALLQQLYFLMLLLQPFATNIKSPELFYSKHMNIFVKNKKDSIN